ncbi:hypothetical protein GCM10027614_71580 [Micromonospora vulcania]
MSTSTVDGLSVNAHIQGRQDIRAQQIRNVPCGCAGGASPLSPGRGGGHHDGGDAEWINRVDHPEGGFNSPKERRTRRLASSWVSPAATNRSLAVVRTWATTTAPEKPTPAR